MKRGCVVSPFGAVFPLGLVFLFGALVPSVGLAQISDLPSAVGTVVGPTRYKEVHDSYSYSGARLFTIPIEIAPAPDDEFDYSVSIVGIEADGEIVRREDLGEHGDLLGHTGFFWPDLEYHAQGNVLSFPAGTSSGLSVLFVGNEVGSYDANYEIAFNDGTVMNAMLTSNISAPPFTELPEFGTFGNPPWISSEPVDCSEIERRPMPENGFLVAEQGCVELISIPVSVGNGLQATKLVARGVDPDATLVTITNLSISNAHQVFNGGGFGMQNPAGSVFGKPEAGPLYHEDWIPYDSHLLMTDEMVGGLIGNITESKSGSSSVGERLPSVLVSKPMTGPGTISMDKESDAFFLLPDYQTNMLDIAYLVSDGSSPVELTLGVLGTGIRDAGSANGAAFGYGDGTGRLVIPLSASTVVPEPNAQVFVWFACILACSLRRRFGSC